MSKKVTVTIELEVSDAAVPAAISNWVDDKLSEMKTLGFGEILSIKTNEQRTPHEVQKTHEGLPPAGP